jgi:hypothetical protein
MAVGYDYSYESFTCIESRTAVPGAISGHICPCLPNITHPAFSGLLYPFSLRLSPSPSDPIDAVSYRDTKTCSSPCTGHRPHPSDRSSALLLNGKRHVISLLWAPTSVSEKRRWVATDWKGHGQSSPPHGPIPAGDVPKGLLRATCMPLVSDHGTVQRWEFHASLSSCPRRRGILGPVPEGGRAVRNGSLLLDPCWSSSTSRFRRRFASVDGMIVSGTTRIAISCEMQVGHRLLFFSLPRAMASAFVALSSRRRWAFETCIGRVSPLASTQRACSHRLPEHLASIPRS